MSSLPFFCEARDASQAPQRQVVVSHQFRRPGKGQNMTSIKRCMPLPRPSIVVLTSFPQCGHSIVWLTGRRRSRATGAFGAGSCVGIVSMVAAIVLLTMMYFARASTVSCLHSVPQWLGAMRTVWQFVVAVCLFFFLAKKCSGGIKEAAICQ